MYSICVPTRPATAYAAVVVVNVAAPVVVANARCHTSILEQCLGLKSTAKLKVEFGNALPDFAAASFETPGHPAAALLPGHLSAGGLAVAAAAAAAAAAAGALGSAASFASALRSPSNGG